MKYPLGKLLKNFANMSRAEILVYLKNQEKELRSLVLEESEYSRTQSVAIYHFIRKEMEVSYILQNQEVLVRKV